MSSQKSGTPNEQKKKAEPTDGTMLCKRFRSKFSSKFDSSPIKATQQYCFHVNISKEECDDDWRLPDSDEEAISGIGL